MKHFFLTLTMVLCSATARQGLILHGNVCFFNGVTLYIARDGGWAELNAVTSPLCYESPDAATL